MVSMTSPLDSMELMFSFLGSPVIFVMARAGGVNPLHPPVKRRCGQIIFPKDLAARFPVVQQLNKLFFELLRVGPAVPSFIHEILLHFVLLNYTTPLSFLPELL